MASSTGLAVNTTWSCLRRPTAHVQVVGRDRRASHHQPPTRSASGHHRPRPSASRAGAPGLAPPTASSWSVQSPRGTRTVGRRPGPRGAAGRAGGGRGAGRGRPTGLGEVGEVVRIPVDLGALAVERHGSTPYVGVRVPAAGYATLVGGRSGWAGRRSTTAAPACRPPAWRGAPSRPATTSSRGSGPSPPLPNSATPQRTSGSSSPATHARRRRVRELDTQSWRPSTHATSSPVGSGRGSITAAGTGTIAAVPATRSATTSWPASAAATGAVVGVGGVAR